MSAEAESFGRVVDEAIRSAGGVALAQHADAEPAERDKIAAMLGNLGVWDLEPAADPVQAEAAAAVCRAAGRYALPYPVAERLSSADPARAALALVDRDAPARVAHLDLDLDWQLCDSRGFVAPVATVGAAFGGKLSRFVCSANPGAWTHTQTDQAARLITLQGWTLLGLVEQASQLTYRYVQERIQFGHPLAHFQAIQFTLTDVAVAVDGLAELAKYALWSSIKGGPAAMVDAVALRLAATETADTTFRAGHQLHGAIGFCDETPISWLSRSSQTLRRLPWGLSQTEARLVELVDETTFAGPFERVRTAL
ncbi:acyl-CoA dehydrogenase family protein [Jatrophihabitans sp.]|uniref:acyl-CoA dehydrogenase family protein n=1 Tax=Jatrophihabitans sp. TaxID=1932789 RepID=UPI0030C7660C|nr:acyl-CoA dehydrogenase protein [Jatrophihabitans sp.]